MDRVPFGAGLGWWWWAQTLERWRAETGRPDLDPAAEFGFDPDYQVPRLRLGIWPEFEPEELRRDAEFVVARDERGITKRNRLDSGSMPEFLDYPVKSRADWERLRAERLQPRADRVAEDWPAFRARVAAAGAPVQIGYYPYGVFGAVRDLMGVERLLLGFHDCPDLLRDIMETLTSLWLSVYEPVCAEVRVDHLHIWEDMSGKQGSLISPRMVEEFMMPCYDRLAAFARAQGIPVISVDTDGNCAELVPVMLAHGVTAFLPFEVQAGNDIRVYRERYPELGIIGGLDKRALARGRREIDAELAKAETMMRGGRYLPCFDHHIPPDVPWVNYEYAVRQLKELCYTIH